MDPKLQEVVKVCLSTIMTDEPWKDFGYSRRPRTGVRVQWLRRQWKVDLEYRLLREMLVLFSLAYIKSFKLTPYDITSLSNFYTFGNNVELWQTFGFNSSTESLNFFTVTMGIYDSVKIEEWNEILHQRLELQKVLDKKISATLMVGSIRFIENVKNMILVLSKS